MTTKTTGQAVAPTSGFDTTGARDAQVFDASSVIPIPGPGEVKLLASVALPSRYIGVLEFFTQFTDLQAREPDQIDTPELRWLLLMNGRPIDPYVDVRRILNPWGYQGFPLRLRVDRGARLELFVRHVPVQGAPATQVSRVGGRIAGRYWFDGA